MKMCDANFSPIQRFEAKTYMCWCSSSKKCCIYGNIELNNHQYDAAFDELRCLWLFRIKVIYLHRCYTRHFKKCGGKSRKMVTMTTDCSLDLGVNECYVANSFLCSGIICSKRMHTNISYRSVYHNAQANGNRNTFKCENDYLCEHCEHIHAF